MKKLILISILYFNACSVPTGSMGMQFDPFENKRVAKGYTIVNIDGSYPIKFKRSIMNPDIFEADIYIGAFMGEDEKRRRIEYEASRLMDKYPEYNYYILEGVYKKRVRPLERVLAFYKGHQIRIHMIKSEEEFDKWNRRYKRF